MAKISETKYKEIMLWVTQNHALIPQERIKVKVQPLLNGKCHLNSYEFYKTNNDCGVVPVICVDKTMGARCNVPVFMHFINCTPMDERVAPTYIDVTLGNMGKELYNYYIVGAPFHPKNALQMIELLEDGKIDILGRFYKNKKKYKKLQNCI